MKIMEYATARQVVASMALCALIALTASGCWAEPQPRVVVAPQCATPARAPISRPIFDFDGCALFVPVSSIR